MIDYAVGALFLMPFYVTGIRYYSLYFKNGYTMESEDLMGTYLVLQRKRKK